MVDKVDIRVLQSVRFENFLERDAENPGTIRVRSDVDANDLSQILSGSGLHYDAKTQTVARPGEKPRYLFEEAATVQYIRDADTNGDGYLDMKEADAAVKKASLTADEAKEADPEGFLKSIQELVDTRYSKIAKNLQNHRAELIFKPMLDYLRMYSRGILVDQLRHAEEVLPWNGLTKSATNVVLVLPSGLHNVFTSDANDAPLMVGDALAATHAQNVYSSQTDIISRFESGIEEALRYEEKWAQDGDFKAALENLSKNRKVKTKVKEKVTEGGKEIVREVEKEIEIKAVLSSGDKAVLANQLVGLGFYDILTTADDSQRIAKLLTFAKEERPGFLGFGSGNSPRGSIAPWHWGDADSNINFWNYTGAVNNLYASRGILSYLVSKSEVWQPFSGTVTPEMLTNSEIKKDDAGNLFKLDRTASEKYQEDARMTRLAIMGTGGNFANAIECRVPGLGINCETWGDEAKMGIPGRALEMGLAAYLGYKGIRSVGNAWELGRIKGAAEPFRVWWRGARWFKPVPAGAFSEARLAAAAEEAEAIKNGTKVAKPRWFGNRAWEATKQFFYDKTLAKLPALSEAQKAGIAAAAAKAPGKGIVFLTDATLVLGIVRATDKRSKAYSNPFSLDYELDLSKKSDPTKPDPILSAAPKKK